MKVRFTPTARRQFLSGLEYIKKDKPSAARKFKARAEKVLKRLVDFPNSGHRIPEFPELPHREVIVPPYRLFYRIDHNTVWIVAVWHGAQDTLPPQT